MCLQSAVFDIFSLEISYFWQSSSLHTISGKINLCIFSFLTVNLAITYSWTSTSKVILGTHLWQSIYILSWHSKYWCNKFLRECLLKYCKPSFIRMQENKARFTKVLLSQIVHTWHPCEVVLFLVYKHRLSPQNNVSYEKCHCE